MAAVKTPRLPQKAGQASAKVHLPTSTGRRESRPDLPRLDAANKAGGTKARLGRAETKGDGGSTTRTLAGRTTAPGFGDVATPKVAEPEANQPFGESTTEKWMKFERRRHRIHAPTLFDEAHLKFNRFVDSAFVEKHGSSWMESWSATLISNASQQSLARSHSSSLERDGDTLGAGASGDEFYGQFSLRKARFFDDCWRADRSVETPRAPLPKRPPNSSRERRLRKDASIEQALVKMGAQLPKNLGAAVSPPPTTPKAALVSPPQSPRPESTHMESPVPSDDDVYVPDLARSMGDLVTSCKQAKLHPVTTGIIRASGEDTLKLEYGCLTDSRAEAMTNTLRATSADVRTARFRCNGLTEKGAGYLLAALPEAVEVVDLSQNDLSYNDGWVEGLRRLTGLRRIDLQDCQLSDNVCKDLCKALMQSQHLTALNFAGNYISRVGVDIGTLITSHKAVTALDLRWNRICRDSAHELLRGLIGHYKAGGQLRTLDLSWNPLGSTVTLAGGKRVDYGDESSKLLAQMLHDGRPLQHLDISNCELRAEHCRIIAAGLEENTTLLGLHVEGNEASVDIFGHLVPGKVNDEGAPVLLGEKDTQYEKWYFCGRRRLPPKKKGGPYRLCGPSVGPDQCDSCRRFTAKEGIADGPLSPSGGPSDQRRIDPGAFESISHKGCCWVCDGWAEAQLNYIPDASGPDAAEVRVSVSTDGFRQATPMTRFGNEFRICVLAPPGELQYLFLVGPEGKQVGDPRATVVCSRTAAVRTLLPQEFPGYASGEDKQELREVNVLHVAPRQGPQLRLQFFVPRQGGNFAQEAPPQPWAVERSLFAAFDEPLGVKSFADRCFEVDWRLSEAAKLVPDDRDRLKVREVLRSHYQEIKVLYRSLCSTHYAAAQQEPQAKAEPSMIFGIGLHEYTHMLVQHGLFSQDLHLENADAQFILAAVPTKTALAMRNTWNPEGHLILRHQFLSLLIRLATEVFSVNEEHAVPGRTKAKTIGEAVNLLMKTHILHPYPQMKYNALCLRWRVEVLQTEKVEGVLRKYTQGLLEPLFKGAQRVEGGRRVLAPEDWFRILDAMEVLPYRGPDATTNQQHLWDRVWLWQSSSTSRLDELTLPGCRQLSFVEFLEAIARLAALLRAKKRAAQEADSAVPAPPPGRSRSKEVQSRSGDYGLGTIAAPTILCADKAKCSKCKGSTFEEKPRSEKECAVCKKKSTHFSCVKEGCDFHLCRLMHHQDFLDKDQFARTLDEFLQSPQVKKAVSQLQRPGSRVEKS